MSAPALAPVLISNHIKILNFISLVRDSHPLMVEIFTKGSCFNFHLILKQVFSELNPIAYSNGDHVITKIENKFYDITGQVQIKTIRNNTSYIILNDKKEIKRIIRSCNKIYKSCYNKNLTKKKE